MPFETGSLSYSTSDNQDGHGSASRGTSTQLTGRPLLPPEEAMRLRYDRQVVLRLGRLPVLTAKLQHCQDREFAGLADG